MLKLALAVLLFFQSAALSQTTGYRIAGQVVRGRGTPVRGAHVAIFLPQNAEKRVTVISGENGEFSFTNVPAGKYSLQVADHDRTQLYKQFEEFSTAIAVGPGCDSEHIVFELQSPAQIVGSVVDEAGDPVRNATLYLFDTSMSRGTRRTELKETKTAASDGSFHFTHLDPGTYYVGVVGRPWYAQNAMSFRNDGVNVTNVPPPPELDVAYPLTYYAGSSTPDGATAIHLEPGNRIEIHFTLQPVRALHIALEGYEDKPEQRVTAALRATGPGGTLVNVPSGQSSPGMLGGVPPGKYLISVTLVTNGQLTPLGSPDVTRAHEFTPLGSQDVTLASDTTLHVTDTVNTSVTGKLKLVEGEIPPGLNVLLEGVNNSNNSPAPLKPDGSFDMDNVVAGRYNLRLANTPELYIQSVIAKNGEYANGVLQVNPAAHIELSITAARGLSSIEGVAVGDGKPIAGAMVLAIPRDYSHGNYIPRDQSDSDGSFSLNFAPPGQYTVIAIDNGRDLEYANPAVIAPYLSKGQTVTVPQSPRLQITVQSR